MTDTAPRWGSVGVARWWRTRPQNNARITNAPARSMPPSPRWSAPAGRAAGGVRSSSQQAHLWACQQELVIVRECANGMHRSPCRHRLTKAGTNDGTEAEAATTPMRDERRADGHHGVLRRAGVRMIRERQDAKRGEAAMRWGADAESRSEMTRWDQRRIANRVAKQAADVGGTRR